MAIQVDMTRDMTELTVKWRAMDFAAQDMRNRLDANAPRIRRTLAKVRDRVNDRSISDTHYLQLDARTGSRV